MTTGTEEELQEDAARPAPPPPCRRPAAARRHRQHRHDHLASRRRPQYPLPRQPRLLEVPVCAASAGSLRSVAPRYCMASQSGEDGWRHHREEEVDDSATVTYDPAAPGGCNNDRRIALYRAWGHPQR